MMENQIPKGKTHLRNGGRSGASASVPVAVGSGRLYTKLLLTTGGVRFASLPVATLRYRCAYRLVYVFEALWIDDLL
jgi:hypothetical protein